MSPEDRDRVWKGALGELKTWTQMQQKLPTSTVVYERALKAVRKVAYEKFAAHEQLPIIASEISDWLCRHHDPDKRRPQPKTSRADRCLRDEAIALSYSEAEARGVSLSVRELAHQFNLSPATTWRALQKAKCLSTELGAPEDADLARIKRVVQKLLPKDGKRAIDVSLFSKQLAIDERMLWRHLNAFSKTNPSWHFHGIASEVIISRGRNLTLEQVVSWRSRARPRSVIAPQRQLQDFGHAVWSDLLSIVAVWSGNASADDWLEMIKVVTVRPTSLPALKNPAHNRTEIAQYSMVDKLVCADPNLLGTRVRAGLKLGGGDDQVRSIERINKEYTRDAKVMAQILYLVEYSWGCDLADAITIWLRVSSYALRIQLGMLPGRDSRDIETFLSALRESETGSSALDEVLGRYASL